MNQVGNRRGRAEWVVGLLLAAGAVACGSTAGGTGGGLSSDGGTGDGGQGNVTVQETILVVDAAADGGTSGTDGGTSSTDGGTSSTDGGTATPRVDPNLVNPWGIAASPQGPFWISDNGTGMSSVFDAAGNEARPPVTIPPPPGAAAGTTAAPTGVVANPTNTNFKGDVFIFATEDGTIAGWQSGNSAVIRVDNSGSGAVYKGITIANNTLFAANFNSGMVDMFDTNFNAKGSIRDANLPTGFAPFNVASLNNKLYVSFAKQDAQKHDDVAGPGNGFIDTFDTSGTSPQRLVSNGVLDSPWGMVIAPANFGAASGKLIVGNFGDGRIHIFDPSSGALLGQLERSNGAPIVIDGLWGLIFGNGAVTGPTNALFFTAGPAKETHGIFGRLDMTP